MKRLLTLAIALAFFSTQNVFAWGYAHKLIAAIAEKQRIKLEKKLAKQNAKNAKVEEVAEEAEEKTEE